MFTRHLPESVLLTLCADDSAHLKCMAEFYAPQNWIVNDAPIEKEHDPKAQILSISCNVEPTQTSVLRSSMMNV